MMHYNFTNFYKYVDSYGESWFLLTDRYITDEFKLILMIVTCLHLIDKTTLMYVLAMNRFQSDFKNYCKTQITI